MAGRYRKSINLGGGFKLNLNAKSASISGGVPGARVTVNTKGQRTTSVGVPGTGVSYRTTTNMRGGAGGGVPAPGASAAHTATQPPMLDYPTSSDEKKFTKVVAKSVKKPDGLREWLNHGDLGEAANIVMGVRFYANGQPSEAATRLAAALAGPPSLTSEGFFARHPLNLQLELMGVPVDILLGRSGAALLLATVYYAKHDWLRGESVIGEAEPGELSTALAALFAQNLNKFNDVLHITRWSSGASHDPFNGLALIVRGCAFRELGKEMESRMALEAANGAVARCPALSALYYFELGRTWALMSHGSSAARNYFGMAHRVDPNYPGLEDALAALPDA